MPVDYTDDIVRDEIERIPEKFRAIVRRSSPAAQHEESWDYFAYRYAAAFRVLANEATRRHSGTTQLDAPVFYLGRHSIELHIKACLKRLHGWDWDREHAIGGHSLQALWEDLVLAMNNGDIDTSDRWSRHIDRILRHLDAADPSGNRFRYPEDRKGVVYPYMAVDLDELIKAHWHVEIYHSALMEMVPSPD